MNDYKYHFLLTLSYDGSNYHGWAKQVHEKQTVQGVLEKSLEKLIKTNEFHLLAASKTDAGVHARGQRVHLGLNFQIQNLEAFVEGWNKILPGDIYIQKVKVVSSNFQVRKVKQKTYEYVLNLGKFNYKKQRFETWVPNPAFDLQKFEATLNLFVGQHEFFLFSGLSQVERTTRTTMRTIDRIEVQQKKMRVKIIFQGEGFLRYQIRMIVGTALRCATSDKALSFAQIQEKLQGIGTKTNLLAPPNGLTLKSIRY